MCPTHFKGLQEYEQINQLAERKWKNFFKMLSPVTANKGDFIRRKRWVLFNCTDKKISRPPGGSDSHS